MRSLRVVLPVLVFACLVLVANYVVAESGGDRLARLNAEASADSTGTQVWIELSELQLSMGLFNEARQSLDITAGALRKQPKAHRKKFAGSYYQASAWLAYLSGAKESAVDYAEQAVRHAPGHESRLILGLSKAANGASVEELRPIYTNLNRTGRPSSQCEMWWILLVAHHRGGRHDYEESVFLSGHLNRELAPRYELLCRQDIGYVYESHDRFPEATEVYELGVQRSGRSSSPWAVKSAGIAQLEFGTEHSMPYWINRSGGFVAGSASAYAGFACGELLKARSHGDRVAWAERLEWASAKCLAVYGDRPWPWLWRSLALQAEGKSELAAQELAVFEEGVGELCSSISVYCYAKGRELLTREKYADAATLLAVATSKDPEFAVYWSDLGVALASIGERESAMEAFNTAIELSPDWAAPLHNRGVLRMKEGQLELAISDLSSASAVAPEDEQISEDLQRALRVSK